MNRKHSRPTIVLPPVVSTPPQPPPPSDLPEIVAFRVYLTREDAVQWMHVCEMLKEPSERMAAMAMRGVVTAMTRKNNLN